MFLKVFLRSFFIQAGWNYERFQNLGFAFCLQPALEKIYPDREKLRAAVLRHLQIFNTQPYMASFVLGNMASLEERVAAAGSDQEARLKSMQGIKQALASSFASIGDRIFWGRLKPMTAQICLLVWAAGGFYGWLFTDLETPVSMPLLLAGPLAGIVFYSAFAVYWRWRGLKAGYACGGEASCGLDCANWPRLTRILSTAGFSMSVAIALLAFGTLTALNYPPQTDAGGLFLKIGLPLAVLALHRVTRTFRKSVFFAAGLLLAVSVLLFSVLKLRPFKFYSW
ncbi:MAG: PTS system mannose/fructose/sorbose family transporter subunit IID [Elusimicrobiota bacterium]